VTPRFASPLWRLLKTFSWQELRHHPWQNAAAVVAVMLGVALAFAVQLINASALDEFAQGLRAVNGQPDLEFRGLGGRVDESLYPRLALHPDVAHASPLLEISTYAVSSTGQRQPLRIWGVDALVVAQVSPALMPQPVPQALATPAAGDARFSIFAPDAIFLNASAERLLPSGRAGTLAVQTDLRLQTLRHAGSVAAPGAALAVMDLGAAQDLFSRAGQLSRVDVKLKPGVSAKRFVDSLQALPDWPADISAHAPGDALDRISNLSRAYRVNMTALAFVALFTGAFLVFSVLSLSVAKRLQAFALLGVLGLTGPERLRLVLLESAVLGLAGSVLGLALGTALASAALRLLGGDLGGGYFPAATPALHWNAWAATAYGALGVVAALAGGWWPARQVRHLPPAQALKGLAASPGAARDSARGLVLSVALLAAAVPLAMAPALYELPIGAYLSAALLLMGGITALPGLAALLLNAAKPLARHRLLPLLALERARRVRGSASSAISGVVAALSLAVALTVMVASFRDAVTQWLDVVLPADLYLRTASSTPAGEAAFFTPAFTRAVVATPGVARLSTQRTRLLQFDASRPAVALLARDTGNAGNAGNAGDEADKAAKAGAATTLASALPLVGEPLSVPTGQVAVYVSEAMADLYNARPGTPLPLLNKALSLAGSASSTSFFVAGVWRDYARQGGSIAIDRADYERLTGDTQVNDLALWLAPGASATAVQAAIQAQAPGQLVEFASAGEIRAVSLRIFDRSFAVTYWLQAVAIGIGLFGVAASFSAQVLSRRKEFGLLAHLGLTRRQVLAVVAGEGLAWTSVGALAGLALGLAVAVILVHVVNPQSFHWTMDLAVPWLRLGLLCLAVVAAGTFTAWLAGRAAAGQDAVLAVKEDW
jgi:putative ABC transport system permease protein